MRGVLAWTILSKGTRSGSVGFRLFIGERTWQAVPLKGKLSSKTSPPPGRFRL